MLDILLYYHLFDPMHARYSTNLLVNCPHPKHEDRSPSCSVNLLNGLWKCHSCDATGTKHTFVQLIEEKLYQKQLSAWQVYVLTAQIELHTAEEHEQHHSLHLPRYVTDTPTVTATRYKKEAEHFFFELPRADWQVIRYHYLQDQRNFENRTLIEFDVRLNHSAYYQIVLPIFSQRVFKGYIQRLAREATEEERKYLNSNGFEKTTTVGGNLERGPVLVVEGWLDLMKAWQYGFHNVCCLFGWSCSPEQAEFIALYATELICGLDNDAKGERGYEKLKTLFPSTPMTRMTFPVGTKDICAMDPQYFSTELLIFA